MALFLFRLLPFLILIISKSDAQNQSDAPDFADGENLSFDGCGEWRRRGREAAPWRAAVTGGGATSPCLGVLLSNRDLLTIGCSELAEKFIKDKFNFRATLGACYDRNNALNGTSTRCAPSVLIKEVALVAPAINVWILESPAGDDFTPICIFNEETKQLWSNYSVYDSKWNDPKAVQENNVNETWMSVAPSEIATNAGFNFLVRIHLESGRHFLRGFWSHTEGAFRFVDVIPMVRKIVENSYGLYIMPQTAPTPPKTEFGLETGLNGVGCGVQGATKHPWLASLSTNYGQWEIESFDFCSATLISNSAVITAAHCLYDGPKKRIASNILVTLGMIDSAKVSEDGRQMLTPSHLAMHPLFRRHHSAHDVALLLFPSPGFNLSWSVRPICVWDEDFHFHQIVNRTGLVTSWGNVRKEAKSNAEVRVKELEAMVLPHRNCYLTEKNFFARLLRPGLNFCAARPTDDAKASLNKKTACTGDSGTGLVFESQGRWMLRGIVSQGVAKTVTVRGRSFSTCDTDYPALFNDVLGQIDWILQILCHNFTMIEK